MDLRTGSLVPEHGSKSTRIGRDRVPVRHFRRTADAYFDDRKMRKKDRKSIWAVLFWWSVMCICLCIFVCLNSWRRWSVKKMRDVHVKLCKCVCVQLYKWISDRQLYLFLYFILFSFSFILILVTWRSKFNRCAKLNICSHLILSFFSSFKNKYCNYFNFNII